MSSHSQLSSISSGINSNAKHRFNLNDAPHRQALVNFPDIIAPKTPYLFLTSKQYLSLASKCNLSKSRESKQTLRERLDSLKQIYKKINDEENLSGITSDRVLP